MQVTLRFLLLSCLHAYLQARNHGNRAIAPPEIFNLVVGYNSKLQSFLSPENGTTTPYNHKRNFVVKCEGDSLV